MRATLFLAVLCVLPTRSFAQETILFGRMMILPDGTPNTRFASDELSAVRPALSLNGINCTDAGTCGNGYGWAEVMQRVEANVGDIRAFYRFVAQDATRYHGLWRPCEYYPSGIPPTCYENEKNTYFADPYFFDVRESLETNARRLQTLALFTLTTLILERNGVGRTELNAFHTSISVQELPYDHAQMLAILRQTLAGISNDRKFRLEDYDLDADKMRTILANLARAVDLYLALENAYTYYYGPNDSHQYLLSQTDKDRLMGYLIREINRVRQAAVNPPGANPFNRLASEPGNLATLVRATCGYASLAYQKPHSRTTYEVLDGYSALDHLDAAIKATIEPSNGNDHYNYAYTSGEGQPVWAEGPYYLHYAAGSVVQFWHAARTTQLNTRPVSYLNGRVPDPFRLSRLTAPLEWLADLTTPQGGTPPFDDGNRHWMYSAHLLAWDASYGDAAIGRKFAWIDLTNPGARAVSSALLSLSIPKAPLGTETAPPDVYGYGGGYPTYQTDQVVVRKETGGRKHYLAVNAEGVRSPLSITRGHGHEQPDNINLVYYIDETSVIMDQGYDTERDIRGSSWNNYRYQNGIWLTGAGSECEGLPVPFKAASPPVSYHRPASTLITTQRGQLQHVYARQTLNEQLPNLPGTSYEDCSEHQSEYTRDVVVVGAFEYVVDINANLAEDPASERYALQYAMDAEEITPPTLSQAGASNFYISDFLRSKSDEDSPTSSPLRAYLYPMTVEVSPQYPNGSPGHFIDNDATVRERTDDEHEALTVSFYDVDKGRAFTTASIITASAAAPIYTPKTLWSYGGPPRAHQGLAWQRSPTLFDVLLVRSAEDPATSEARVNAGLAGAGYPKRWLGLPAGKRFGFARVEWNGSPTSAPALKPGYTLDLQETAPIPLLASISGPTCAIAGQPAHFNANASGGLPPYVDYTFEILPECSGGGGGEALAMQGEGPPTEGGEILPGDGGGGGGGTLDGLPCGGGANWSFVGSGTTPWVDVTSNVSYRIRVRATDSDRLGAGFQPSVATSAEWPVTVSTWCPNGPGGASQAPTEQPTLAAEPAVALPTAYALDPPAPNPFVAQARFRFALPEASAVRLVAYDVLGRQVAVLAEGLMGAGWHEATLDGAGLPRGLYVVRLTAGAFTQTRTITLAR